MILNYIRIALRNLWKNKSLSLINVVGLALGMAIALLSLLYVTSELTFDRLHEQGDQIYRVIVKMESAVEGTTTSAVMTAGPGPTFRDHIPEISQMVRVSTPLEGFFTCEDRNYPTGRAMYADSSFFRMFSFNLVLGNPEKALAEPYNVVLTREMALKMFETEQAAMGQVLLLNNRDTYRVTGIVEDVRPTSHLRFDALFSFESLYEDPQMYLGWNGGWNYSTYFLLQPGSSLQGVEEQMVPLADENINNGQRDIGVSWNFFLQPLHEIHLNTHVDWDIDTKGSRSNLLLFVAVTFVILVIACINFINLTTANAITRMKEVGVRKVSGAGKRQIVSQFLVESAIVSIIALFHAIIFIEVFYLWVSSQISDPLFLQNFELYNRSFFQLAGGMLLLIVIVGLAAGGYPALYIARIKPAIAVKGKFTADRRTFLGRNLLVVFQFTISVIFIICTLVIATQLDFLVSSEKGFEYRNRLVIPLTSESAREQVEPLKQTFLTIPGVMAAGASSELPGQGITMNGYFPEGHDKPLMFHALDVDYEFLETIGVELVQGRGFSKDFGQDQNAYLINQALARKIGWTDPVGKTIRRGGDHPVIGVVKDFNFSTLHNNIEPLIITIQPWRGYSYLTVQAEELTPELKKRLAAEWTKIVPYEEFEPFGLEQFVNEAYGPEKQFMQMLLFCACMTIFIAALGLFGLSAFMTRRRYREIAVRKVFGAGLRRIFTLVSASFLKWILLANLIAWPVAFYIMDSFFLTNFAYSTNIKWWVFAVGLLASAIIALLVIFYQITRLSRLNPVEYIRYE